MVEMNIPKLPNDLIMGIIKLADGGKTAHQSKMKPVLELITNREWTKENKYTNMDFRLDFDDDVWFEGDPPPTAHQQLLADFYELQEFATMGHQNSLKYGNWRENLPYPPFDEFYVSPTEWVWGW